MDRPHVNYVSGHLDLTPAEFDTHYRPAIDAALDRGESFVIGDARGADALAQQYLLGKTTAVVIYHMFASPGTTPASRRSAGSCRTTSGTPA